MSLDKRLNAFRDDLADVRLDGMVTAKRFAAGRPAQIVAPVAPCLRRPHADAPLDTEFLFGETVMVFDEAGGFGWVQSQDDGYVGYVPQAALAPRGPAPTHRVSAPLALVYAKPSIKVAVSMRLPLGAALALEPAETVGGERFHKLVSSGYILAQHVTPIAAKAPDFVAVAEGFIGTPYLFGGKSWLGIDCSALTQVALKATGHDVLRDSDMQAASIGTRLPDETRDFQRGDLIFWTGHVGILRDPETLLHANGFHMATAVEPVSDALDRLAGLGLPPTAIRRIEP